MNSDYIIIILAIIAGNLFSCYFWIWLYKELFHSEITIGVLIKQGALSALGALSIIRLSGFQAIFSKVVIEEGSKTLTSEGMNGHILASDHIATAVLAGVGFAVIENILYIYYLFDNSLIQISIVRLLTNSIVHGLFTGLIGYGIFQFLNQKLPAKKLFFLLLFSLTGIGSHVLYNYSMSQSRIAIGFIFVIVGYFLLSFLLYKSDRLYIS